MKPRNLPYGDKNICGKNVERLRKGKEIKQIEMVYQMQLMGVDINPSSLSKLESQRRIATDKELWAMAQILGVPMSELITVEE